LIFYRFFGILDNKSTAFLRRFFYKKKGNLMRKSQIKILRGSAVEHADFTGEFGEITVDETNKTLRVHDGETAGGIPLAKKDEIPQPQMPDDTDSVIEFSAPGVTPWFRKWKSGWVEQGGVISANGTYYFPISFIDTSYNISFGSSGTSNGTPRETRNARTAHKFDYSSANNANAQADWIARGYAA
jgi:hypothetical protein